MTDCIVTVIWPHRVVVCFVVECEGLISSQGLTQSTSSLVIDIKLQSPAGSGAEQRGDQCQCSVHQGLVWERKDRETNEQWGLVILISGPITAKHCRPAGIWSVFPPALAAHRAALFRPTPRCWVCLGHLLQSAFPFYINKVSNTQLLLEHRDKDLWHR